jgi:hypothetical protein
MKGSRNVHATRKKVTETPMELLDDTAAVFICGSSYYYVQSKYRFEETTSPQKELPK